MKKMKPYYPECGDVVAGLYEDDNTWHRALVNSIEAEQVQVTFLDHGGEEILKPNQIQKLHHDLTEFPIQVSVNPLYNIGL